MIKKLINVATVIVSFGTLFAAPVAAQSLSDCDDWRSSAFSIAEPWEANTKLYAQDTVRLAIMDAGEPVSGSYRLLILATPQEEPIERSCTVMSFDEELGFAGLSFEGASDATDPAVGVTIKIPAKRWIAATDTYDEAVLTVTVKSATGEILGQLD